jgi:hypothetical protein
MQHYGDPDPINPGSVGGADIAAAEAALAVEPEGEGRWTEGVCGDGAAILFDGAMVPIEEVVRELNGRPAATPAPEPSEDRTEETAKLIYTSMRFAVAEEGRGSCDWVERGNSLMQDEARRTARAILAGPDCLATPPAPELLEANFRAWHKEARGSLYYGAIPLCDAIEWAQHLLQQVTLQALVPPAVPAPPITEPSALPELVRYGFISDGPNRPLMVRLVDGYWTPWHIAATLLQQQEAELATLRRVPVAASEKLRQIGDRLRNQDNRCTANPIFLVRGKERIYGLDSSASDEIVWMDDEWSPVEIPEGADPEEPPHGLTVVRYTTRWKALMVAFTEQGCKEHLRLNGHNYQMLDEVGISVYSLNRCPEMIAIREFLMELPAPQAGEVEALQP